MNGAKRTTKTNVSGASTPDEEKETGTKSKRDWIETIARWIVDIFSIPISFAAYVLAQFLRRGGSGTKALAGMAFIAGVVVSSDNIWQTLFRGTPMFWWFEQSWMGWQGWLLLPFNPVFYVSLAISAFIQVQEAKTLRSKPPAEAKQDFEEAKQYTLPEKPKNAIDVVGALWKDYKRSGMRERNSGGLYALFFWIFDLVTTFGGRNPFQYTGPGTLALCLFVNLLTMAIGEIAYSIWKDSSKQ